MPNGGMQDRDESDPIKLDWFAEQTGLIQKQLDRDRTDAATWTKLIDHQDSVKGNSKGVKQAILEKKLAIIDKALASGCKATDAFAMTHLKLMLAANTPQTDSSHTTITQQFVSYVKLGLLQTCAAFDWYEDNLLISEDAHTALKGLVSVMRVHAISSAAVQNEAVLAKVESLLLN